MNELKLLEKLQIVTYVPGIAEYAVKVKDVILGREDSDFILAVDLPHGLEYEVMTATKRLPKAFLIVDQLYRGIPIIPTSAPVEAVRCFQERGFDLKFIDTCLPVTGNLDDYRYFIEQCRHSGIGPVMNNAAHYGISHKDLMKSWIDSLHTGGIRSDFYHIPEVVEEMQKLSFYDELVSPYLKTRLQYMALKLRELLETGNDVILVCSVDHVNGIMHFLKKPLGSIDDSYVIPSRICAITEDDILKITQEVPYFIHQYDLFRGTPVDRRQWITDSFCCTSERKVPPNKILRSLRFAYNLALTDRQIFPDIYNLVAAAKYCVNDEYAYKVYKLLKSYPPSGQSISECSLHNILDYNFQPLASTRNLSLKISVFEDSPYIRRIRQKILRSSASNDHYTFTRLPQSIQAEREFMKYMTSRFTAFQRSEENYQIQEFSGGFCEGIDVRETIRKRPFNKIYVREQSLENRTCYILDYRSFPFNSPSTESTLLRTQDSALLPPDSRSQFCSSKIFLDTNFPWVGLASSENNHYICGLMVAFFGVNKDPIPMMNEISYSNPLESAVAVGLRYAKHLFVFTDFPEEINGKFSDKKNIRILPTATIPAPVFKKMHEFDIVSTYNSKREEWMR
jgi:hypothetical protein